MHHANRRRLRDAGPDAIVSSTEAAIFAEKFVEHAAREPRDRSYNGAPMYVVSVSVSVTVGGRSLDELLAGPLASRSTFAQATVWFLREAKYTLLPTYAAALRPAPCVRELR